MKVFYLTASIILTVVILILAFGNIQAQCTMLTFFFYPVEPGATLGILGVAVMGILTGACYHGFISRVLSTTEEEDEGNFE